MGVFYLPYLWFPWGRRKSLKGEKREGQNKRGGLVEALKVLRDTAKDTCMLVALFGGLCLYWLRPSSEEIFHCLLL